MGQKIRQRRHIKMKTKILIVVAFLLLITIGFSGCIDEKSKFIGN
jgi:hypothetical protein